MLSADRDYFSGRHFRKSGAVKETQKGLKI